MKINAYTLILGSLFLVNCAEDGITPVQRIEEIGLFDVGNEGTASDIKVAFEIENVAGINEFRVFIIPTGTSRDFSKEDAFLLTEERYKVVPLSDNEKFSVRLSGLRDVTGEAIITNKSYVVKILMIGETFNQLSILESNRLSIQDQGIYNGYYEGILVTNVIAQDRFLPSNADNRTINLRGTLAESSSIPDNYIGQFITEIPRGGFQGPIIGTSTIRFSLDDGEILNFVADRDLNLYTSSYINCDSTSTGKIPGAIMGTSKMEIIGTDCSRGKLKIKLERAIQ